MNNRIAVLLAVMSTAGLSWVARADVSPPPTSSLTVATTPSPTGIPDPDAQYEFHLTKLDAALWGGLTGEGSEGPRAGETVQVAALRCQRDDARTRCTTVDFARLPELAAWAGRLAGCFRTRPQMLSEAALRSVEKALGDAAQGARSDALAGAAAQVPNAVVAAAVLSTRTVDEFRAGGCDGPRPPNRGCDPVSIPTGRKIQVKRTEILALGPGPYRLETALGTPPFPRVNPVRSWIVIKGVHDRILPDMLLAGGGDLAARLAAFRTRVEPWLTRSPGPRLRAALLVDLSYASFLSGDATAGRRFLGELDQLTATAGFDGRGLELDALRRPLRALATGAWSTADPCAKIQP